MITLRAHIDAVSSGGQHAIQIARALAPDVEIVPFSMPETGIPVPKDILEMFRERADNEWNLVVRYVEPRSAEGFLTRCPKAVLFADWVTTGLPDGWANWINLFKAVIVPSDWVATVFAANGVTAPIHIVPMGIHTELYRYRPMPIGDFTFGTAGTGPRKGIQQVIEAFRQAFPSRSDVRLRVKVRPCDPMPDSHGDGRIDIIRFNLRDDQMADWYASLHVFVSASCGEGWGLMGHQAAAVGRPLIAARFGGMKEYFHLGTGFMLDYRLRPSGRHPGHWAEIDTDDISLMMVAALHGKAVTERFGAKASDAAHYWDEVRQKTELLHALKRIGVLE